MKDIDKENKNIEKVSLLKMKKEIQNSNLNANILEEKIYSYGNNILSDKERIMYETEKILETMLLNSREINQLSIYDLQEISLLLEKLIKIIDNKKIEENIILLKKILTKLQIKLNLYLTFYSVTDELLLENKNINKKKELV